MWIVTPIGFFSGTRSKIEPDKIQVRARARAHLEALQAKFADVPEIAAAPILDTTGSDYRWRIILSPEMWGHVCCAFAADAINYSNFKDYTHDKHGGASTVRAAFDRALMACWSAMMNVQRAEATEEDTGYGAQGAQARDRQGRKAPHRTHRRV